MAKAVKKKEVIDAGRFPKTITIESDGNTLELVTPLDNETAKYRYTKSKSKLGEMVDLSLDQIKKLSK